ncbi:MAG TPA: GAF domain-containing protein [Candidatus Acidoferrum sp.]|nr:GAF domain-containing protein [Candidatus Acidoferrum sp.]
MSKELQEVVERAVAQALERQLPKLQAELVKCVLADLPPPAPAAERGTASAMPGGLVQAIASIHAGSTQKEILKALLDAGTAYASRVALFVVKGGAASGWQARGLPEDDQIKDFPLDMTAGPASHAFQNRIATPANIAEMDRRFVKQFGGPSNEQIVILPLVLKDKVAALLYADGGAENLLDAGSLEVLVMATSAWLEVASLRKQAQQRETVEAMPSMERPMPPPAQPVSSFSDPFAAHSPKHIARAPEPEPEPAAEVVEVAAAAASASAAAAPAADPFAGLSAEDADTHRKAQRFARLLVDEIKLYNQAKVNEGRRNKDLYDRLKEDIDKSRTTFQKRYGSTVAASGDYFQKEVVRSLAEDDFSVMGANFKK